MAAAGQHRAGASSRDSAMVLAEFAVSDLGQAPADVLDLARVCLIDAVACAAHGAGLPWSRMVAAALRPAPGPARVPGTDMAMTAERAAYLAGVCAHGFELDSLRKPGAGVHPGATVALPALMVAQEVGATGAQLLSAIVAGIEVMFRIGSATLHSSEARGFHAPGMTGTFGAAVAAGRLLGLSVSQMAAAFGIAGSCCGGILAFAGNGTGGMVKRLHLGRANEAGLEAVRLAASGYEGPRDIFEARFGILEVYCQSSDPALLLQGLGETWEIRHLCLKRYACHVTAQGPVEQMRSWIGQGLDPDGIRGIAIAAPRKIADVHSDSDPQDLALAQYALPFMLALAAYHDVEDPACITEAAIRDPRVRTLAGKVQVSADAALRGWAVRMTVSAAEAHDAEIDGFLGAPDRPLSAAQLKDRFQRLTGDADGTVFDSLRAVDKAQDVSRLLLPTAFHQRPDRNEQTGPARR